MKDLSEVKYAIPYSDNSGNRMSLKIDTKEKDERYQCRINDTGVTCSLEDLIWLKNAITDAIKVINKKPKKVKKMKGCGKNYCGEIDCKTIFCLMHDKQKICGEKGILCENCRKIGDKRNGN